MPEFLERQLNSAGRAKGLKGKKLAHYTYGAMNNMGAMRGNKITPKGARMQKKHESKVHAGITDLIR